MTKKSVILTEDSSGVLMEAQTYGNEDGETYLHVSARYALFAGSHYYPSGGWGDHVDNFETLEAAIERGNKHDEGATTYDDDWAHVVDLTTWERVWSRNHYQIEGA
ncbi:hypothetical protein RPALISO_192 [Ruegeria phage RpAliso]|nr:hypothetical protein RPALISO_192 [Ruegeria phage RpAliso]